MTAEQEQNQGPPQPDRRQSILRMASGTLETVSRFIPGSGILKRFDLDLLRRLYDDGKEGGQAGDFRDMHGRNFFRPPGAVHEDEFLDLCSRCRKCVDACPEQVITPAQEHMGPPVDTPILMPNRAPCTLCGDCMEVCPTGALQPTPLNRIRIGIAVVEPDTCLGYQGDECTACRDACPLEPNAIQLHGAEPKVDSRICTGCGLCVPDCPTDPMSIVVLPRPSRSGSRP